MFLVLCILSDNALCLYIKNRKNILNAFSILRGHVFHTKTYKGILAYKRM